MDSHTNALAAPLYDNLLTACQRIVGMDGTKVEVEMRETEYVLEGRTYFVKTPNGTYPFWIGVNGPRLFFIAYVHQIDKVQARDMFQFCFGGAEKVGWHLNYEPIPEGVSVWATCMTDRTTPLTSESQTVSINGAPKISLTREGVFWVTDIAMMVQSWIRTCQRLNLVRHELEPAPL